MNAQSEESQKRRDTLFVWRHGTYLGDGLAKSFPNADRRKHDKVCPYCRTEVDRRTRENGWEDHWEHRCLLCGFSLASTEKFGMGWRDEVFVTYLAEFGFDDDKLALAEIGTHLRRSFSDISQLSSFRFEQLVGDMYRTLGFHVRHTKKTRDGGYDLVLLESSTGRQSLVECKRWLSGKVDVGVVRQLAGVQLQVGVPFAKLVATTSFTSAALKFAGSIGQGASGYELDLIDAARFSDMLQIYNTDLPPLYLEPRLRGYPDAEAGGKNS